MMIERIKYHLPLFLLLILTGAVVYHIWFTNLSPITYGDWYVGYSEKSYESFSVPSIWNTDHGVGGLNLGIFFWPTDGFIAGLFAHMKLNPYLGERLLFLWPIAILTMVFMYALAYHIFKSRPAAIVAALAYSFNLYSIILSSGHLTVRMAITLIPLLLLLFIVTLDTKRPLYATLAGLVAFAVSFYEFRLFYVTAWMLGFYTLYHILLIEKKNERRIKTFLLATLVISLPLLLNTYSLLSTMKTQVIVNDPNIEHQLIGTWYIKLINLFTIFQHDWTGGKPQPWVIQPMPLRFILFPIIYLAGYMLNKKKKQLTFFALLGILGIFIIKMDIPPFPLVYEWLFKNLPGFYAFREGGKFGVFSILAQSVLVGAFIDYITRLRSTAWRRYLSVFLTAAVAFLYLYNTKPIITGELGGLFVQRNIPQDYLVVKNYILEQPEYFRTIWIPTYSRWSIYVNNHPRISYYDITEFSWNKYGNLEQNQYLFRNLLNLSSVKYVFVPLADDENDDNFFERFNEPQYYINKISELGFFNNIDIGTKEIVIFENANFRPHIYLTQKRESVYANVPFQRVEFESVRPTQYKIHLEKLSRPVYLNFAESFHPEWKVRAGELDWLKSLTEENYFLPDSYHYKNTAGLNSFFIDPRKICFLYSCLANTDGSYNIDLNLYYKPQSYVYIGGIVSIFTFTLAVAYLMLQFTKIFLSRYR